MILVSTIEFSDMPDMVVWPKNLRHCVVGKSKMAAIFSCLNNQLMSFLT